MLQYTFIFDTVRLKCHFRLLLFYLSFSLIRLKYIINLSRSATPFLPHHLLSPTLFSSPIALICFTPPSFSLPYSLQLPLYHHWSIKIRFTGFFFPFSQIFFGSLLFVLWSDIPNRKFISELPIRRSIWATTDLLFTISQIPPSTHHKISFTGYFSPFFPLFFRSLPSILWSHTPNRFSSSPLCSFGFVLVLFLSMSLVQLFFVCCLALLKAIYYYILLLSLFWFWNSSWFVSLWYPYDLYFWDCCFVVVYLLWCNFVRLSVQSVLWWFICYGVIVADYTNKIQKPKSSHSKLKKLTKGMQHKFWEFIPTWFSFKVRFRCPFV